MVSAMVHPDVIRPLSGPARGGTHFQVSQGHTTHELPTKLVVQLPTRDDDLALNCSKVSEVATRCCCMPPAGTLPSMATLTLQHLGRVNQETFTYYPDPTPVWLSPQRGALDGGTLVTVGMRDWPVNHTATARCKFGGMHPVAATVIPPKRPMAPVLIKCTASSFTAGTGCHPQHTVLRQSQPTTPVPLRTVHGREVTSGSARVSVAPNGFDFPSHARATGLTFYYGGAEHLWLTVLLGVVGFGMMVAFAYAYHALRSSLAQSGWQQETPPYHWPATRTARSSKVEQRL
jgi:hypothetical protein